MRLIDADKLTDGKGVFNKAIHADFERVGGAYIMIKDLLSILDNQPTIGEWIPVEERLPKWGERALTCDAKGNIHIMTELKIPGKPFGVGENHPRFFPVVAWMPLPEPYRPELDE